MTAKRRPKVRGLAYDFPLRTDFMAQIVLPHDLKPEEAARLCAMIQTLTVENVYEARRRGEMQ